MDIVNGNVLSKKIFALCCVLTLLGKADESLRFVRMRGKRKV